MINIPPLKSSTAINTELLVDVTKTWKVGQILSATTEQGGKPQSDVLIRMGQQLLQAKTPVNLETGQTVKLLVKNPGNPQLNQLPLLTILGSSQAPVDNNAQIAASKLRQFIAVQQSFSLLQQAGQSLQNQPLAKQQLPQPLLSQLQTLQTSQQLEIGKVDATQLKQQLLNSGLFLENRLLQQAQGVTPSSTRDSGLFNDLKFQLLSIKAELSQLPIARSPAPGTPPVVSPQLLPQVESLLPSPGRTFVPDALVEKLVSTLPAPLLTQLVQLLNSPVQPQLSGDTVAEELQLIAQRILQSVQQQPSHQQNLQNLLQQLRLQLALLDMGQQVDNALAKITSLQLQPLSREGDSLMLLLFNMVFRDAQEHFDVQFRIEQEDEKAEAEQQSWKVQLTFQFASLGKVQSDIHLINDRVSSVFHAEKTSTAEHIRSLLPLLDEGLGKAGLTVVSLDVTDRLRDEPPAVHTSSHILDENA